MDKFLEGLVAMGLGMGTVLLFLCLMIIAMFVMSACVKKLNKIFPEAVPQTVGNKKSITDDSEIAAAIVAAMFKK